MDANIIQANVKGPLRCEGAGRLHWGEEPESKKRVAVRFVPLEANGQVAVESLGAVLPVHSGLPTVRQVGVLETEAFAVLDFPHGRLLSQCLTKPVEERKLLRIARDIADALAAAHAEGIAHGELSAGSVLLLPGDEALLWDLPLVLLDRLSDRRGEARGLLKLETTAEFLAPERAGGEAPSAEGDVWALAALLCRAAGGPRPQGASTLAIVHLIASGEWLPKAPSSLPVAARELITRMLSLDPTRRPAMTEVNRVFGDLLLRVPTLQEMPAVVLPATDNQTTLDPDLPKVRPDPPRSARPDVHALPTIADDSVDLENAIDAVLPEPPRSSKPEVHAVSTDIKALPAPKVPWTKDELPVLDAAEVSLPEAPGELAAATDPRAPQIPPPVEDDPVNTDPRAPIVSAPRSITGEIAIPPRSRRRKVTEDELLASLPRESAWRLVGISAAVAVPLCIAVLAVVFAMGPDDAEPVVEPIVDPAPELRAAVAPPPPSRPAETQPALKPSPAPVAAAPAAPEPIAAAPVVASPRPAAPAVAQKPPRARPAKARKSARPPHGVEVWPPEPKDDGRPVHAAAAPIAAPAITADVAEEETPAPQPVKPPTGLKRPDF